MQIVVACCSLVVLPCRAVVQVEGEGVVDREMEGIVGWFRGSVGREGYYGEQVGEFVVELLFAPIIGL